MDFPEIEKNRIYKFTAVCDLNGSLVLRDDQANVWRYNAQGAVDNVAQLNKRGAYSAAATTAHPKTLLYIDESRIREYEVHRKYKTFHLFRDSLVGLSKRGSIIIFSRHFSDSNGCLKVKHVLRFLSPPADKGVSIENIYESNIPFSVNPLEKVGNVRRYIFNYILELSDGRIIDICLCGAQPQMRICNGGIKAKPPSRVVPVYNPEAYYPLQYYLERAPDVGLRI